MIKKIMIYGMLTSIILRLVTVSASEAAGIPEKIVEIPEKIVEIPEKIVEIPEKIVEIPEEIVEIPEEIVEVSAEKAAEEKKTVIVGQVEGDAFQVCFTNNTGLDLVGVSVKEMSEKDFQENMLNQTIADQERFILYYKQSDVTEDVAENDKDEKILTPGFDVKLQLEKDDKEMEYTLHAFPFEDLEEAEINLEEDLVYIRYVSKSTGEEISTKDAEMTIAETGQEKAETELEKAGRGQEKAETELEIAEGDIEESSSDDSVSYDYGAYSGPYSGPFGYSSYSYYAPYVGGGADACITDGLLY